MLQVKQLGLGISLVTFLLLNVMWLNFDAYLTGFHQMFQLKFWNLWITFGIDGFSFFFLYLTSLLVSLCLLFSWNNNQKWNELMWCLLSVELLLFLAFTVLDVLFFYIFFELILIPFFVFIGYLGYRKRRIHAAYLLFFYTVFGSFFMLVGLVLLWVATGTTDWLLLSGFSFEMLEERVLWLCFFMSFAVKVPMFPFHLWLPEAHVEAPTEGSVLLAGVLLKLGTYGFLRFLFPLFPNATYYFSPVVIAVAGVGVVYSSLVTLRQIDMKRIIAYSSVSHMNMCVLGLFNFDTLSFLGSILVMIGHGIVSSALFFCIGIFYSRYHTKLLAYYSGLVYAMPLAVTMMFLFTLGNMSLPGTSNFIGEFLMVAGVSFKWNLVSMVCFALGIFISTIYSMWLFNKMSFGLPYGQIQKYLPDLTMIELVTCVTLLFFMFWFGIYPRAVVDLFYHSMKLYNVFLL